MSVTRRDFLKAGAAAASLAALPRPLLAAARPARVQAPAITDADVRELAMRALDAARSAGAAYADVRLTHGYHRQFAARGYSDSETMEVGVRALVQGYWGFASGPVWTPDEMARLGREAYHQAKTNALGKTRVVDLAPTPVVANGHWATPVEVDPLRISPFEVMDYLASLDIYTTRLDSRAFNGNNSCTFTWQEKAFASSEGSYCTQRLCTGEGNLTILLEDKKIGRRVDRPLDLLTVSSMGWELYRGQPVRESIRRIVEELKEDIKLPIKPVDVGRYDAVIDAWSVAKLLDETIGRATELDRALGYEANAGGTSYINAPLDMVGSYQAGAPVLHVTAERSAPGGAATVKWDDEGVVPDEFTLVKDGVLADMQTTRESARWLAPYYARRGVPVRSHGCATADSAIDAPLQQPPNLTMRPGREALDFDAMVAGLDSGIAVRELKADMDVQNLNGLGTGRFYEVKKGKRVALINQAGVLFRAPELWKGIHALGGSASAHRFGRYTRKGEPEQFAAHSVTAVPTVFKQLTLIDPQRKA
ncbi:MAG TPA: metallopeptidase TldD-related protein [Gemmatimonadaceae bacterium]|nr:metallopeptidase TldD-related protein [Gemmatimonadaceae bacterium]